MRFKELRISDRSLFENYFRVADYELSNYSFSNIFIWKNFFKIFYVILDNYLCLFFKDKNTCFMYFPPLPSRIDKRLSRQNSIDGESRLKTIDDCFLIMDRYNINKEVSRIENIEEEDLSFFKKQGYIYFHKPGDYIYRRRDIALLRGNRYKSKRSSYNYFIKHYECEFRPFLKQDIDSCLLLYKHWSRQRKKKFPDSIYQAMIDYSFLCQRLAMRYFTSLRLIGYVAKIKGRIAGYTLGYPVNQKTFCILFEVCDLHYRGISQFIFSQFCQALSEYEYINIMDDSGLENLRKVKLSYHPVRILPSYIIKRNHV